MIEVEHTSADTKSNATQQWLEWSAWGINNSYGRKSNARGAHVTNYGGGMLGP